MTRKHNALPQLEGTFCLTDGGMETDLLFNHGIHLPEFASYDLLRNEKGRRVLADYYRDYIELARGFGMGLILETPTWRANPGWMQRIGDAPDALVTFNHDGVKLVADLRDRHQTPASPIVVSGCIGPGGDGYRADTRMSADEARDYHAPQVRALAAAGADLVSALTMNYIDEAIGITRTAQETGIPVCISFTVETDGRLPTGESLDDALAAVDAATEGYPLYYMINCAHPTHFMDMLEGMQNIDRLKGIRANASRCSHAELDEAETLDDGNPHELGEQLAAIRKRFPHITVLGGCCGTDARHIREVAESCGVARAA